MEATRMRLVLAGSDVADLGMAQKILIDKGVSDVIVCQTHSQVVELLQQCRGEGVVTVIIAQQVRQFRF